MTYDLSSLREKIDKVERIFFYINLGYHIPSWEQHDELVKAMKELRIEHYKAVKSHELYAKKEVYAVQSEDEERN